MHCITWWACTYRQYHIPTNPSNIRLLVARCNKKILTDIVLVRLIISIGLYKKFLLYAHFSFIRFLVYAQQSMMNFYS